MTPQFLIWFEDSPKKTPALRLQESCAAFTAKFGQPATVVRVHPATPLPAGAVPAGLTVEVVRTVPVGQVWPGADCTPVGEAEVVA
jgi:hypothetical protein